MSISPIVCTAAKPWDKTTKGVRVMHVDAHEVGEQEDRWPYGYIVRMRCKNCGHEWKKISLNDM